MRMPEEVRTACRTVIHWIDTVPNTRPVFHSLLNLLLRFSEQGEEE